MRQTLSKGMVVAAAATGMLSLYGSQALADTGAQGAAQHSAGVLSGNTVQVPVNVPVNVCGNSVDVVAALNPAFGNSCANGSVQTSDGGVRHGSPQGGSDTSEHTSGGHPDIPDVPGVPGDRGGFPGGPTGDHTAPSTHGTDHTKPSPHHGGDHTEPPSYGGGGHTTPPGYGGHDHTTPPPYGGPSSPPSYGDDHTTPPPYGGHDKPTPPSYGDDHTTPPPYGGHDKPTPPSYGHDKPTPPPYGGHHSTPPPYGGHDKPTPPPYGGEDWTPPHHGSHHPERPSLAHTGADSGTIFAASAASAALIAGGTILYRRGRGASRR
ncbi:chaplin family protein [Streptomyces collinus]|uniref:chaplin family protein n=1 Tax=Streptomyces collinus TaxID=42684 RepID=UPI002941CCBA|nr:chaplin family protein [Streptomyces collinus]